MVCWCLFGAFVTESELELLGSNADVEAGELEGTGPWACFLPLFLGLLDAEMLEAGLYKNHFCWTGPIIMGWQCVLFGSDGMISL